MKKINFNSPLFVLIIIAIPLYLFVQMANKRQKRLEKGIITTAFVYDYNLTKAGITLYYSYNVRGKNFQSTQRFTDISLSSAPNFRDSTFPLVYTPDAPSESSLLITPDDFLKIGVEFPDSLNWVLQYLAN